MLWMDEAARMAYELLINKAPARLPVDAAALIRSQTGVELLTYTQAALLLDLSPENWRWEAPSPDAFTLIAEGRTSAQYKILYDETKPPARRRFTLAHELGHLLFHRQYGARPHDEAAADCFARHLLCPPALTGPLQDDPRSLAWAGQIFGLSQAAVTRLSQSPCGRTEPSTEQLLRDKFLPLLSPR